MFERLNIPEEETEQEHDLQKMEQVTTTTLHTQLEKERSDFTILTLGNLGFLYLGGRAAAVFDPKCGQCVRI